MSDLRGQLLFTIERSVEINDDHAFPFHTFLHFPRGQLRGTLGSLVNDFTLIGMGFEIPYLDLKIENQMLDVFEPIAEVINELTRSWKQFEGLEKLECLKSQYERIIAQLQ